MRYILIVFIASIMIFSCKEEAPTFDESPYIIDYKSFPVPNLPSDNPLTIEGVKLGRKLFYEEALSKNLTQSCADCHVLEDGFSDLNKFSIGVENLPGKRQAMAIFNMAYHKNEFFWDGRAEKLRDQALKPIQDPLEMNETLDNVVSKLSTEDPYSDQFYRAFGDYEITSEKVALALEQFMLSIISNDSKYDRALAGEIALSESEDRGRALFMTEFNPFFPEISGADCMHCHGGFNFENDLYMNNGIDEEADITDFGRETVTLDRADRGKFKVPTLRNIALTPPYMHDGRFSTLEEVIDHYNEGIKESETIDKALLSTKASGLQLTDQDKTDLIAFLHTLTDETFINNQEYATPF